MHAGLPVIERPAKVAEIKFKLLTKNKNSMKTNFIKKFIMLLVVSTFSMYNLQAQTDGYGALGGTGCTAANDGGVAGNTSIGCSAGNSGMTGANNTSIGEAAGTALTSGAGNKINNSTGNNDSVKNILDIKLTLPEGATLGDAQPNPNNGSTQISYFLPDNISVAQIIFTDMLGKVIQEKSLQPGYGLLNIDTQDLPTGIYSYSLVVDGKVIDNKKMIRNK